MYSLGRLIAECSLRLMKPECHLSHDWSAEPLDSQFFRAVILLHGETVGDDSVGLLSAASFTYCFQLLQLVLNLCKDHNEPLSIKCLELMASHASRLRGSNKKLTTSDVDEVVFCNIDEFPCTHSLSSPSGSGSMTSVQTLNGD